jgi:predicted nucleic acid-binding Zn ribbon protein|tara:strand:- start:4195 stop:4503 length:309 start_codon:yes stop_codon:yes gene_type:complete
VPIYVYQTLSDDPEKTEVFEIQQSMQDAHLAHHPETGEPIRRVLQAPNIASKYTPGANKTKLENNNLAEKGFTKYEKDKLTGRYHRTAGKEGPPTIEPQKGV